MTRLISLEIINSKRFTLTRINRIVYTPKELTQVIVGTNGCGKSSLKEECTPIPSQLGQTYNTGGGKIIKYHHNGKIHRLQSGIELGNKHSYVIDGEELNPGGTMKVQLELVEENFGITPWINDFIIGKTNFSSFNIVDRRRLLTHIDKLDYTFMLEEFNKHRINLNDTKGALKVAVNKIDHSVETLSALEVKDLNAKLYTLTNDRFKLDQEITTCEIGNGNSFDHEAINELNKSNNRLIELSSKIHKDLRLQDVVQVKKQINIRLTKLNNMIDANRDKINNADEIARIKNIDLNTMNVERDSLISNNKIDNPFNVHGSKIYEEVEDFSNLIVGLEKMFRNLDVYKEIYELKIDDVIVELDTIKSIISYKKERVVRIEERLKHLNGEHNDETVSCPKCETEIHIHDKTSEIRTLEEELKAIKGDIPYGTCKKIEAKYERVLSRDRLITNINNTLSTKHLHPFTFHAYTIVDFNLKDNYHPLLDGLKTVLEIMKGFVDYVKWDDKLKSITETIRVNEIIVEKLNDLDVNVESIFVLREREHSYNLELNSIKKELENNEVNIVALNKIVDEVRINRTFRSSHINNYKITVQKRKLEYLVEMKELLVKEIAKINKKLIENNRKVIEREVQNTNITTLRSEVLILETLVSSLSPSTGIIGDALRSFMDMFLEEINETIRRVWSYDMKVNPCEVNRKGQLDYKFPVSIDGVDKLTDISFGSLSMKEIFDLAFRLTSVKLMGLDTYPLFLDEFSNNMDDYHKEETFKMIGELGTGRQLFLISHFVDFYGGLSNSEVNVISKKNVRLDSVETYNTSMKITRD